MIKVTNKDSNYLAKIVEINKLKPIEGADNIQIAVVDFQDVVVSKGVKEGDLMVFFPIECQINDDFLSFTNSFRDKTKNSDPDKTGFFDDNGRVRAIKLFKGTVKSEGYLAPLSSLEDFAGAALSKYRGEEFDTINNVLLVKKYEIERKSNSNVKQGKEPKTDRLVDGQVRLHVKTEQLVRNVDKLNPNDTISISYKTHGTSWWVGNLLVKRPLSTLDKLAKFFGVTIKETVYDLVYGSRRVVKNKHLEDPKQKDHFYGYDFWEDIKNEIGDLIPKGYTLYGEAVGYTNEGSYIQKGYDYGQPVGKYALEVYRITNTNVDGVVTELSTPEIVEFCETVGLKASYQFFNGTVKEWMSIRGYNIEDWESTRDWREAFIERLKLEFNEKDCFMCKNKVPEEGVVIRKENLFSYDAFKLKSFRFLEWETKELDKGESNIEDEN